MKKAARQAQRKYFLWRNNRQCFYCEIPIISRQNATIDHIIPRSRNGANRPFNFVISCYNCNFHKDNLSFLDFIQRFNWLEEKQTLKLKAYHQSLIGHVASFILNNLQKYNPEDCFIPSVLIQNAKEHFNIIENLDFHQYQLPYYLTTFDINHSNHKININKYFKYIIQKIQHNESTK